MLKLLNCLVFIKWGSVHLILSTVFMSLICHVYVKQHRVKYLVCVSCLCYAQSREFILYHIKVKKLPDMINEELLFFLLMPVISTE